MLSREKAFHYIVLWLMLKLSIVSFKMEFITISFSIIMALVHLLKSITIRGRGGGDRRSGEEGRMGDT